MDIDKARLHLEYIIKGVNESRYNCDCQIGGVDALSIDTDWMMLNLFTIYNSLSEDNKTFGEVFRKAPRMKCDECYAVGGHKMDCSQRDQED